MIGIMVAICKIIEKNRDIIVRVLNFYVQEINFYFKRFLPCLCVVLVPAFLKGQNSHFVFSFHNHFVSVTVDSKQQINEMSTTITQSHNK